MVKQSSKKIDDLKKILIPEAAIRSCFLKVQ